MFGKRMIDAIRGRWLMLAGIGGASSWMALEYISSLPSPLDNCHYPLRSRFYIQRALWSSSLPQKAYYLDCAMRVVLQSGYGGASPQSTNLVIYLSQLYLEEQPPQIDNLRTSFEALLQKPHVGEGVSEERARLEMGFRVGERLIQVLPKDNPLQKEIAQKALTILDKAPPYLGNWKNHKLRPIFAEIVYST